MNAKKEFLETVEGYIVKCATVTYTPFLQDTKGTKLLKVDHTNEDYLEFLKQLDFNYDDGYGSQEVFGTIWLQGNKWAERGEYDGSEWWKIKELPKIPQELK